MSSSPEILFAPTRDLVGKQFPITDKVQGTTLDVKDEKVEADKTEEWIKFSDDTNWPIKFLNHRRATPPQPPTQYGTGASRATSVAPLPFSKPIMEFVTGSGFDTYYSLWRSEMGGCVSQALDPMTFFMQTPTDGGPFCSLAMWHIGRSQVRGTYSYSHDAWEPWRVIKSSRNFSGWRSTGLQMLVFPLAFVRAHIDYINDQLMQLNRTIEVVEDDVSQPRHPDDDTLDFGKLTRTLHEAGNALIRLDRRARFQQDVIQTVTAHAARLNSLDALTETIAVVKSLTVPQSEELQSLPRRLENQRTMIFNLIVQRDQRLNLQIGRTNLEIAETSRRIAEYSIRDAASMKTIAILTMIFLPGTAVASFFSMTMFNWQATESNNSNSSPSSGGAGGNSSSGGSDIVSPWLWVYFVVAFPLTLLVVAVWWIAFKRRSGRQKVKFGNSFEMERRITQHLSFGPPAATEPRRESNSADKRKSKTVWTPSDRTEDNYGAASKHVEGQDSLV